MRYIEKKYLITNNAENMKKLSTIILCIIVLASSFGCVKDYKVYRNLHTPKGLFDKGVDLYVRGKYVEAIKVFHEVMEKFPNAEKERAWSQYEIGFCYFHMKKFDSASEAFRKVLDEHSLRAPRILAARMIIKIKRGDAIKRSSYVD